MFVQITLVKIKDSKKKVKLQNKSQTPVNNFINLNVARRQYAFNVLRKCMRV